MIFPKGDYTDLYCRRYDTEKEAKEGHKVAIQWAIKNQPKKSLDDVVQITVSLAALKKAIRYAIEQRDHDYNCDKSYDEIINDTIAGFDIKE